MVRDCLCLMYFPAMLFLCAWVWSGAFLSSNYFRSFEVIEFLTKEPRLSAFQIKYLEDYFDMVRDCLCHAFSLIVVSVHNYRC